MDSLGLSDLILISPMLVLFFTSLIPITVKVLRNNKEIDPFISTLYTLGGVLFALGLTLIVSYDTTLSFMGMLKFDGLSAVSSILICLSLSVTVILSREHLTVCKSQYSEYLFLLVNSAVGMMIIAWANNFIIVFIGLELMSLCLYVLIAMSLEERRSKEAAFKYFILGSLASAIFLYGVSFLYGTTGSAYFVDLSQNIVSYISTNRLFLIGIVLVVVGLMFKVSIFPFHSWTPDIYQGSPTPLVLLMATGVKVCIFAILTRFFYLNFLQETQSDGFILIVQWMAIGTILVGNMAAVLQTNLKRLFAYSGIAHSGYIMIGLIITGTSGDASALVGSTSVMFYLLAYVVVTMATFSFLALLENKYDVEIQLSDLKGFAHRNPALSGLFALTLLSLAGIPPLVGFFAKFFIFSAALAQGFYWLAFWGIIGSLISVYYYLRPLAYMYMEDKDHELHLPSKPLTKFIFSVMALLTLILGLFATVFYDYIANLVTQLI